MSNKLDVLRGEAEKLKEGSNTEGDRTRGKRKGK
jgi:hypothetical protein